MKITFLRAAITLLVRLDRSEAGSAAGTGIDAS